MAGKEETLRGEVKEGYMFGFDRMNLGM